MRLPAIFVVKRDRNPDGYYGIQIYDDHEVCSYHMFWTYRENRPLKERNITDVYMKIRKMLIELEV